MSYKTKNAIEAAMEGNASEFRNTVNDILMDKVRDAVELKKIEVASMFMSSEIEEEVELDEVDMGQAERGMQGVFTIDEAKSKEQQIADLEKILSRISGNTSDVKMKKYAIQRKIDKLKNEELDESKFRYAGTFSLDTDDDMWVLNYSETPGGRETDTAVGDIDGIVKIMKKVKV